MMEIPGGVRLGGESKWWSIIRLLRLSRFVYNDHHPVSTTGEGLLGGTRALLENHSAPQEGETGNHPSCVQQGWDLVDFNWGGHRAVGRSTMVTETELEDDVVSSPTSLTTEKFDNSMSLSVAVTYGFGSAPYFSVMPCLLHAHTWTKFSVHIYHEQTHKKHSWTHTVTPTGRQLFWSVAAFFPNSCLIYLVLELLHHSLHINSVSSSCLENGKLWKSFRYVIPGDTFISVSSMLISCTVLLCQCLYPTVISEQHPNW